MLLVIVFWVLVAYLVLPRLHRILTRVYVPDYFIGRTRTADGLLGDPVNLALMGSPEQVHAALDRGGWIRADELTGRTGWRIVTTTLSRRSYREAPVSPLFLFGRKQDFAYQQEVDGNPSQRHHVRFWKCPDGWLLPGGFKVDWLAAGTYDRSVGLSLFTLQVTHKIDQDTDIEREHIIETVRAASPGAGLDILRDFSTGYHSRNGGGDLIRTDGDLPVLDVSGLPTEGSADIVPATADPRRRPVFFPDRLRRRRHRAADPGLPRLRRRDPAGRHGAGRVHRRERAGRVRRGGRRAPGRRPGEHRVRHRHAGRAQLGPAHPVCAEPAQHRLHLHRADGDQPARAAARRTPAAGHQRAGAAGAVQRRGATLHRRRSAGEEAAGPGGSRDRRDRRIVRLLRCSNRATSPDIREEPPHAPPSHRARRDHRLPDPLAPGCPGAG
ncbi:MAG: LssY C-terminal domain-containing protein [Propionibacteriaceae bacterium]|nr:LssY C-terminal domain-containing protein [Propionibacteriaceae bacterium]